jgi:very-short-patch-repair endonuclease
VNLTAAQLAAILTQPGYSAPGYQQPGKAVVVWPKQGSKLEAKFDQLWALINGQPLEAEYRFHPVRKWRFDRCHVGAKVAIEIQGNGRHQKYVGYRQDRIRNNEAQRLGWTVFELTGDQIGWPELERIRDFIEERIRE